METQVTKLTETLPLGEDGLAWGFGKDLVAIADDYDLKDAGLSGEPVFKVEANGGNVEITTYTTYHTNDSALELFIIPVGTALKDVLTWYEQLLPTLSEEASACVYEESAEDAFQDFVDEYSTMEELINTLDSCVGSVYDGLLYHGTISANGKDYWVITSGVQC